MACALSERAARRGSRSILTTFAVALALALGSAAPASAASYGAVGWGIDAYGQLGNRIDSILPLSETPVAPGGLTGVKEVVADGETSIALMADGTVMAWGENYFGQLGNGSATGPEYCDFPISSSACSATPVPVSGLSGVKAVAGGRGDSFALLKDGTVMAWGENRYGQLGIGTDSGPEGCITERGAIACSTIPVRVRGLRGVKAIAAGGGYALALLKDGTVRGWGADDFGQFGGFVNTESCGPTPCSTTPVPVSGLSGVKAIAAGLHHALAILHNGTVMAWGSGSLGELGNGTQTITSTPIAVSGLSGATAIAAGESQSLALLEDGRVMAWGLNDEGQLGDGTSVGPETCAVDAPNLPCSTTPVAVSGLSGVTAIATGGSHSLAVLKDGAVMGWGWNEYGQLGVDASGPETCFDAGKCSTIPVAVSGLSGVLAVSAGNRFSLAYGPLTPEVEGLTDGGPGVEGTAVTIAGTNFSGTTAVRFGSTSASSFTVTSASSITAIAPAGRGTVDVTVTTPMGTSPISSADRFSYEGPNSTGVCHGWQVHNHRHWQPCQP